MHGSATDGRMDGWTTKLQNAAAGIEQEHTESSERQIRQQQEPWKPRPSSIQHQSSRRARPSAAQKPQTGFPWKLSSGPCILSSSRAAHLEHAEVGKGTVGRFGSGSCGRGEIPESRVLAERSRFGSWGVARKARLDWLYLM